MGKTFTGLFIMIMFCEYVLELSFGTTMFLIVLGMMGAAGMSTNSKSSQKPQKQRRQRR